MIEVIAGALIFIKEKCGEALLTIGLEKGADWLISSLKRNAVESATNIALQKIDESFGDAAGHQLKLVLTKHKNLKIKIVYKSQKPAKTITAMKKAMIAEGSAHSPDALTNICQKFIEFFHEELPKAEKASHSQTAANNELQRLMSEGFQGVNQVLKEIRANQTLPQTLTNPQAESSREISTPSALDSDEVEFRNSKYKQKIDEAKVLTDRQKFKSAKEIYLQLLEEFKADAQVPRLVKFKVYNNLGVCQRNLGEASEASVSFKAAFNIIGPTSIVACKNRAVASLLDGKPLEGLSFIDAAIALAPDDTECLNIKAMLLSAGGRDDDAIGLYGEPE